MMKGMRSHFTESIETKVHVDQTETIAAQLDLYQF